MPFNVWPSPVCKGFLRIWSDRSTSTYPVSEHCLGQDGDPRIPILTKHIGVERH
jgi:hypothetical protein